VQSKQWLVIAEPGVLRGLNQYKNNPVIAAKETITGISSKLGL